MNREEKAELIKKLNSTLSNAGVVIVTKQVGLTVEESTDLRVKMREVGAKYQVAKNRIVKLALKDTKYENMSDLFSGPTAISYSDDPVAPAKVSSNFAKKLENFKIIGGGYDGEKIDIAKINFLATLPSMDELRGKILGLISAPAQKIASIVKEPSGQLARLVSAHGESMDKSN